MKPITIKELYKACKEQIEKGNGDKVIMISSDDEGNNFHYLWYTFLTVDQFEEETEWCGHKFKPTFDWADERIAKKKDTIILG